MTEIDELLHKMVPIYNSIIKHFIWRGQLHNILFYVSPAPIATVIIRQLVFEERLGTAERLNCVNIQREKKKHPKGLKPQTLRQKDAWLIRGVARRKEWPSDESSARTLGGNRGCRLGRTDLQGLPGL